MVLLRKIIPQKTNLQPAAELNVIGEKMRSLIGIILCFLVFESNAAHNCAGKVNTVDIQGNGKVNVSIEGVGDGNIVCSLNTNHGEFTPEACKATFSLLTAAKFSGVKVRVYFRNDANTSCNKGSWIDFANSGLYYIRAEN